MRGAGAPGKRVGAGRVRVDAARAIAKLREYQLADKTRWILEAVRAAVASGAERIHLEGDANDVWLGWTGEPWSADIVTRLFDELVSPEPARSGQKFRLLATAVNSALGLEPAYVDVYMVREAETQRVRFTPDVLEAPDDDEVHALEQLRAEPTAPPAGFGAPGMRVHLRRRAGLETLGNFLRGEPPELALAVQACSDVPVPMTIGDVEVGRHLRRGDLLRLELGQDLDGFVAVVDPTLPPRAGKDAVLDIAERGVLVTSVPLRPFATSFESIPLRIFIDAERMPTNASRSNVPRDAYPVRDAEEVGLELVPDLCRQLVERLEQEAGDGRFRHAALMLLAAVVPGRGWMTFPPTLPESLHPLALMPLLRNAVGESRAMLDGWNAGAIHFGSEPYPGELRSWLSDVLWVAPSDRGGAKVSEPHVDPKWAKRLAKTARKQLRARERFLRHDSRRPVVKRKGDEWLYMELDAELEASCVPAPRRIRGELALLRRGRNADVVFLLEDREIEEVELESAIPFRAVVAADVLKPGDGYRSVARGADFDEVEDQLQEALIRAVEGLALTMTGGGVPAGFTLGRAQQRADGITHLVLTAIIAGYRLGIPVFSSEPFRGAPVWPVLERGLASATELAEAPAVILAPTGWDRPSPAFPVIVAESPVLDAAASMLEPDTMTIRVDRVMGAGAGSTAEGLAERGAMIAGVALAVRSEGLRGCITRSTAVSSLELLFHGISLEPLGYEPAYSPCSLYLECDDVVPADDWRSVRDRGRAGSFDFSIWERELCRAVALAFVGDKPEDLFVDDDQRIDIRSLHVRNLFTAIVDFDETELLGEEVLARLKSAPVFEQWGREAVSLNDVAEAFPGSQAIPYLDVAPIAEAPGDWAPLLIPNELALGVEDLLGRKLVEASAQLGTRLEAAERERNLEAHRAKPGDKPSPAEVHVPIEGPGFVGTVALGEHPGLDMHFFFEDRLLVSARREYAVALRVDIDVELLKIGARFATVPGQTVDEVVWAAEQALEPLLEGMVDAEPSVFAVIPQARAVLVAFLKSRTAADGSFADTLAAKMHFPTVDDDNTTIKDARVRGVIRVARWNGEWFDDSDRSSPLDTLVIRLPTGMEGEDLRTILWALGRANVEDVTDEVERLQTARRMSRGLIPEPVLSGFDPAFKRAFRDLDGRARALGGGEIGLEPGPLSKVMIHRHGVLAGTVELDVVPPVAVAIEDPTAAQELELSEDGELASGTKARLVAEVQLAAWALLEKVAGPIDGPVQPRWLRNNLVRVRLGSSVPSPLTSALDALEMFETTDGRWVTWAAMALEAKDLGDVWYVKGTSTKRALDPKRTVICLDPSECPDEFWVLEAMVEASGELELDEQARINRARPVAQTLALGDPEKQGALVIVDLASTKSAARGKLAVLTPRSGALRAAYVHREMHPLGAVPDPCPWPTVAIVDDARLEPDRTWSGPADDKAWEELRGELRSISEAALTRLIVPPGGALTSHWVGRLVANMGFLEAGRVVRGRLWLHGHPEAGIVNIDHGGESAWVPVEHNGFALPVSGSLMTFPTTVDVPAYTVREVVFAIYPRLIRQLSRKARSKKTDDGERDLFLAHVAYGLGTGLVKPADIDDVLFPCFDPPCGPDALATLLTEASSDTHERLRNRETWLTQTVAKLLPTAAPVVHDSITLPPPVFEDPGEAELEPVESAAPPRDPGHPLEPLLTRCRDRFGELGVPDDGIQVQIETGESYLARVDGQSVLVGGDSPRLHALLAGLERNDSAAATALDLLVAHLVTLLNHALTSVTDASELHALLLLTRRGAWGSWRE